MKKKKESTEDMQLEDKYDLFVKKIKEFGLEKKVGVDKKVFMRIFKLKNECICRDDSFGSGNLFEDFLNELRKVRVYYEKNNKDDPSVVSICPNCKKILFTIGYFKAVGSVETSQKVCLNCGKYFGKKHLIREGITKYDEEDKPNFGSWVILGD